MITTANLHQYVDVTRFNEYCCGTYDLEYYGGKCGYVKDDKMLGRVTVFLSGKMISTGAKGIKESIEQLQRTVDILAKERFIEKIRLLPKVQNLVATADLGRKVDLNRAASILPKFSLEPKQFPAAIYKSPYGATCLIFRSGKVVIVGAKSEKQISDTEKSLPKLLNQFLI